MSYDTPVAWWLQRDSEIINMRVRLTACDLPRLNHYDLAPSCSLNAMMETIHMQKWPGVELKRWRRWRERHTE